MTRFPVDAPKIKVIKALELLGFSLVREREHIALIRENADGTKTPVTLPNHSKIKGSTLRTICTQAGIPREELQKQGRTRGQPCTVKTNWSILSVCHAGLLADHPTPVGSVDL